MCSTPGETWYALLRASGRVVVPLNWAIGGQSFGMSEEHIGQSQGVTAMTITLHPFQTKSELIHPYAPAPVDICAKGWVG